MDANRHLPFLHDLMVGLNEAASLEKGFELVLGKLRDAAGWQSAEAWIAREDGRTLDLGASLRDGGKAATDRDETSPADAPESGIVRQAFDERRSIWSNGESLAADDPGSPRSREPWPKTEVAVPVVADDRVAAVLVLSSKEQRNEDAEVLSMIQASTAPLGSFVLRRRTEDALRERETQFRQLAKNMPGVLVVFSPDIDQVLYAGESYENWWNQSRSELEEDAHAFLKRIHPDDREDVLRVYEDCRRPSEIEYRLEGPNGTERWVHTTVFPIRDDSGEVSGVGSISNDITERKLLSDKLSEQAGLARMGEVSTVVAHELKSPLASIVTGLEFILRRLPEESTEKKIASQLIGRVETLLRTAEDMLALARPPQPELRPVRILQVIEEAAEALRKQGRYENIEIDVEGDDLLVKADEKQVRQILLNLVLNATQAVKGNGKIGVTVTDVEDRCRVEIRDDGPGIPPRLRERVFEPFFTSKEAGTGLGLALTKTFVEAHGGSVTIRCPEEGGTVVAVELPMP